MDLARDTDPMTAQVTLRYDDGTEEDDSISVVEEDGQYKRRLTEDDIVYLRGAQEDVSASSEEDAIEATIRDHYEAIGEGDFEEAYTYFGPGFRSSTDEQTWISEEESYEIESANVQEVYVQEIREGVAAIATVKVSFADKTGVPYFVIDWGLGKLDESGELDEAGEWELEEVVNAEKGECGIDGCVLDGEEADQETTSGTTTDSGVASGGNYEIMGFVEDSITQEGVTREHSLIDVCIVTDDSNVVDELAQQYLGEGYDVAVVQARNADGVDIGYGFAYGSTEAKQAYTKYLETDNEPSCPANY